MKYFYVFVLSLLLSACHRVVLKEEFNTQEASYILKNGTGRIEGETFWRTRQGRIVKGSGERVYLIPDTAYARERFTKIFRETSSVLTFQVPTLESNPQSEKLYHRYTRTTVADSRGRFIFERVMPGIYFIAAAHTFDEDVRFKFFNFGLSEGGITFQRVRVSQGGTVNVILSGRGSLL
jgi:hypothetical protein